MKKNKDIKFITPLSVDSEVFTDSELNPLDKEMPLNVIKIETPKMTKSNSGSNYKKTSYDRINKGNKYSIKFMTTYLADGDSSKSMYNSFDDAIYRLSQIKGTLKPNKEWVISMEITGDAILDEVEKVMADMPIERNEITDEAMAEITNANGSCKFILSLDKK
jgi:hypothetical protein